MSTVISGLPPRVAIREEDYATGSYPMVSRVGDDSRLGNKSFLNSENITPFNESFRPDQNRENSFFEIGSKESDTSLGFSSRLSSKTQIKFSFNVDNLAIMNAQTASIMYYNKNTKEFDLAGGSEALTAPNAPNNIGNLGRDARLFNALGFPIISGTAGALNKPSPYHGTSIIANNIDSVLSFQQQGTVTLNRNFKATKNQLIPLFDIISSPFLLEKAVIELNVSSSNGWFNDITLPQIVVGGSDLGGPCVTVSLMNQVADGKRELILSSTIIPVGDTGSFAFKGASSLTAPAGFGSFATPGAVVEATGIQRVFLKAKAAISNGILITANNAESNIGEVSSFGRSLNPQEPSGRSFFGKEFNSPKVSLNNTNYDPSILEGVSAGSRSNIYQYTAEQVSPYILDPKDNLVLSVSKHRPVLSNVSNPALGVTGSHEFGIAPGPINITLYGSLVKEEKEYHDTLNQGLTSNVVHEIIGVEPVLDQYDVQSRFDLRGTYIDEFFTGSIFEPNIEKRRKRRTFIAGSPSSFVDTLPLYTEDISFNISRPGFIKSIQLTSENERYFDTLMPRIDQMFLIEDKDIWGTTFGNFYPLGKLTDDYDDVFNSFDSWDFIFPFESKYSNVTRTVSPLKNSISTTGSFNVTDKSLIVRPYSIGNQSIIPVDIWFIAGFEVGTDAIIGGSGQLSPLKENAFTKNAFGIGNAQNGEPILTSRLLQSPIAVSFDSEVRGFKYGLLNASEEVKKYYFRRDRFGHFRDMVEQSKDSKLFLKSDSSIYPSPIKVRFIGSDGKFTNGEETFSNNVSLEATSSLPYFDGLGRSRGDLPDINIVP